MCAPCDEHIQMNSVHLTTRVESSYQNINIYIYLYFPRSPDALIYSTLLAACIEVAQHVQREQGVLCTRSCG